MSYLQSKMVPMQQMALSANKFIMSLNKFKSY